MHLEKKHKTIHQLGTLNKLHPHGGIIINLPGEVEVETLAEIQTLVEILVHLGELIMQDPGEAEAMPSQPELQFLRNHKLSGNVSMNHVDSL